MRPDLFLDAKALLGEGPAWHAGRRALLWVDIQGYALHVTDHATRRDRAIDVGETIGCVAPADDRLVVAGLRSGFSAIDLDSGARAGVEDPEVHLPDNRFNDGKCDPAGRFWAGTMHVEETAGCGALYCLDAELRVSCKIEGVSVSNGLAWTADARTMYYVDSPTRRIVGYDFDVETGAIRAPRDVFRVPEGYGFPDGMAIDVEGLLWLALWDGRRVLRVDPRNGRIDREAPMPISRPTSCAFGGEGYDELYVTSARTGLHDTQLAAEPLAGGVFVLRPGVTGPPPTRFANAAGLQALFA